MERTSVGDCGGLGGGRMGLSNVAESASTSKGTRRTGACCTIPKGSCPQRQLPLYFVPDAMSVKANSLR
ncbi:hypothetical protein [Paenibacillus sp. Soil766]|uniref:hypothetical protein n=1 Tax=Paenibacillus sp. Soil766 TaxID=1736404 RepID=UPI0012FAA989|nr:hypothetical protein [Paenibacillus sp. Soil766]